jgi:hypothetical protein
MDKKRLEDFVKVATGKGRVIRAKKEPTAAERFAKVLIEKNRKARGGMSEAQLQAGILRGS